MTPRRRTPFTLIEMLAVIAIITVLAGIVLAGTSFAMRRAAEAKTRAVMQQLEIALSQYKEIFGYFPIETATSGTTITRQFVAGDGSGKHGLVRPDPTNWAAAGKPLLEISNLKFSGTALTATLWDAFGTDFQYKCPGLYNKQSYDLWSPGSDGKTAYTTATSSYNNDDLTNWKGN